jgi:oligopeptidase B
MLWRSVLAAFLIVLPPAPDARADSTSPPRRATKAAKIAPPVAARKPARLSAHGIERVDDYAWLRDPNWREVLKKPAVLAREIRVHIEAENRYAKAVLAPLASLQSRLLKELKGRIEPATSEVPLPDGPYAYWKEYVPAAEHPRIVRAGAGGAKQVLVDGSAIAAGKPYFSFGTTRHSPDHRLYAYLVDLTGGESYRLRVRDIGSGRDLPLDIPEVSTFAWAADSMTLFYVRLDTEHRPRLVYRHRLGSDPATDALVYEERDLGFEVSLSLTPTERFILIATADQDTSETWLIDAARPASAPVVIAPRERGLRYEVGDWGDRLLIRTNADGAQDFKIVTAPASAPGRANWRDLIPYRQGRQILSAITFSGHLARLEREDGLKRVVIRRKADGAEHAVRFNEEAYAVEFVVPYEFDTSTLRFRHNSPATPDQIFDYNMETRERVLRKRQKIPSGHDPSAYVVRRLFATTADNEQVPITVLHSKRLPIDGSAPLLLDGYGAYGVSSEAEFNADLFSLVDRGFVYAVAHIRGGSEKGERWHDAGRGANKVNTFNDFIAVVEYLIKAGYGAPRRVVARGDSAGGTLIGAVANMRPDLFAGIIAVVPFVDVLNFLLDESLPLTFSERAEFGDPQDPAIYRVVAAYSPYDNVKAQPYPPMLVTAGVSDPRTQYWEPVKWVAKLRAMKTNDARIVLVTHMSAGHSGAPGRFKVLEEVAMIQAFALDVTGKR